MTSLANFYDFQLKDILNIVILAVTIFAIYIGPIRAVKITRQIDDERKTRDRRYEIFHTLMKTRRIKLSAEHVTALNLVQLEFAGYDNVIQNFKKYIDLLSRELPADPKNNSQFFEERNDGLFDLIHEIGLALNYNFDKRDLARFSYTPQGWIDDAETDRILKGNIIDVLQGRRPFPVSEFRPHQYNPVFPPPP